VPPPDFSVGPSTTTITPGGDPDSGWTIGPGIPLLRQEGIVDDDERLHEDQMRFGEKGCLYVEKTSLEAKFEIIRFVHISATSKVLNIVPSIHTGIPLPIYLA